MKTKIDYDHVAGKYALHREIHAPVLQELLSAGELTSSSTVLEVGCGTCNYIEAVRHETACLCFGIDPSKEMLSEGKQRGVDIWLAVAKAESIPFAESSFDLVFSVDVIHHVKDDSAYYQEAYRVLKPGGRLCTVTDSEEIIQSREPLSNYFPETIPVELARYPRIDDLRNQMLSAGFTDLSETTTRSEGRVGDIGKYRDKAYSCLHLISEEAFLNGMARLEEESLHGLIRSVIGYIFLWGRKP